MELGDSLSVAVISSERELLREGSSEGEMVTVGSSDREAEVEPESVTVAFSELD